MKFFPPLTSSEQESLSIAKGYNYNTSIFGSEQMQVTTTMICQQFSKVCNAMAENQCSTSEFHSPHIGPTHPTIFTTILSAQLRHGLSNWMLPMSSSDQQPIEIEPETHL